MVYKNFLLRSLFSSIFFLIYFFISYINFTYVFYLILLIYFIILIEIILYFKKYKLIPIIYIILSLLFFFNIDFKKIGIIDFNFIIVIIITFDIFSYIIFGKNKLINISPNKTIEGLAGGIIASFSFAITFSYYFDILIDIQSIIFIILIISSSLSGDIIESYFKRKNNLKNSSNFIPGHGGVFDRFDSFLFSIIIYSIFINF